MTLDDLKEMRNEMMQNPEDMGLAMRACRAAVGPLESGEMPSDNKIKLEALHRLTFRAIAWREADEAMDGARVPGDQSAAIGSAISLIRSGVELLTGEKIGPLDAVEQAVIDFAQRVHASVEQMAEGEGPAAEA